MRIASEWMCGTVRPDNEAKPIFYPCLREVVVVGRQGFIFARCC